MLTRERLEQGTLPAPDWIGFVVDGSASSFDFLRSPDEVMRRCHAICAAVAVLDGADPQFVLDALTRYGLLDALAEDERSYVESAAAGSSRSDLATSMSWRSEALWALLWSLGAADHVDPTRTHEGRDDAAYTSLVPDMKVSQTRTPPSLRPTPELLTATDLYYCLHWNEVSARLQRAVAFPDEILPPVVVERRHALEWLHQDEPWDDVDLST